MFYLTNLCVSFNPLLGNPVPPRIGSAGINVRHGNLSSAHATMPSFSSSVMVHVLYTSFPPTFSTFTALNQFLLLLVLHTSIYEGVSRSIPVSGIVLLGKFLSSKHGV